jgi:hypothetical protein
MSSNSMTLIGRLSCLLLIAAFSLAGCASQQTMGSWMCLAAALLPVSSAVAMPCQCC